MQNLHAYVLSSSLLRPCASVKLGPGIPLRAREAV